MAESTACSVRRAPASPAGGTVGRSGYQAFAPRRGPRRTGPPTWLERTRATAGCTRCGTAGEAVRARHRGPASVRRSNHQRPTARPRSTGRRSGRPAASAPTSRGERTGHLVRRGDHAGGCRDELGEPCGWRGLVRLREHALVDLLGARESPQEITGAAHDVCVSRLRPRVLARELRGVELELPACERRDIGVQRLPTRPAREENGREKLRRAARRLVRHDEVRLEQRVVATVVVGRARDGRQRTKRIDDGAPRRRVKLSPISVEPHPAAARDHVSPRHGPHPSRAALPCLDSRAPCPASHEGVEPTERLGGRKVRAPAWVVTTGSAATPAAAVATRSPSDRFRSTTARCLTIYERGSDADPGRRGGHARRGRHPAPPRLPRSARITSGNSRSERPCGTRAMPDAYTRRPPAPWRRRARTRALRPVPRREPQTLLQRVPPRCRK